MTWRPRGRGCFTQYSVQIDEKNTPYVASHSRGPSPPPPPPPLPKPATAVGVCEYGKILFVIG